MAILTKYYIHYPEKLTGKVRIRKGLLGRLIPQVEYKVETFIAPADKDETTMWRDAVMSDILLLGDFDKEYSDSYTTLFKGNSLEDIGHG